MRSGTVCARPATALAGCGAFEQLTTPFASTHLYVSACAAGIRARSSKAVRTTAGAYSQTPDKCVAYGYSPPGMNAPSRHGDLSARDLAPILAVANKLAAPFDLR